MKILILNFVIAYVYSSEKCYFLSKYCKISTLISVQVNLHILMKSDATKTRGYWSAYSQIDWGFTHQKIDLQWILIPLENVQTLIATNLSDVSG